jgi:dTDP-4-amino-4,6-dideoxygalactose transaminase
MQKQPADEIWNYQQLSLGFNYRMTELQAALGLSQFSKLDEFVKARHEIASNYDHAFSGFALKTPWQHPDTYSSYHLYPVQIESLISGKTHKQIYFEMKQAGIQVNLHYIPVYRQPYFQQLGFKQGYCPNAEQYFKSSLSIPLYASMSVEQQSRVIEKIGSVLQ